jgi:hypothetical protein
VADTPATNTASATAASKSVDRYGDACKRDDREQEYCSAHLELSHGRSTFGVLLFQMTSKPEVVTSAEMAVPILMSMAH